MLPNFTVEFSTKDDEFEMKKIVLSYYLPQFHEVEENNSAYEEIDITHYAAESKGPKS